MNPLGSLRGTHRVVTLRMPAGNFGRILCLMQKDANGADAYYVLAENEGSALRWRSMVQGNAVRRLKTEFRNSITEEAEVDALDVETIFLCTTEATKA